MTIKLKEILNIYNATRLIINDSTSKVDSLIKFKLLGIMKMCEGHAQNYEIIRNEKIKEYGKENEEGVVSISPKDIEAVKKFNEDMNKLTNEDINIDIVKFKASDIFDKGILAEYLVGLYPIIEE